MNRPHILSQLALVVVAVVLAACSSGDADDSTTTAPSTTAETSDSPTTTSTQPDGVTASTTLPTTTTTSAAGRSTTTTSTAGPATTTTTTTTGATTTTAAGGPPVVVISQPLPLASFFAQPGATGLAAQARLLADVTGGADGAVMVTWSSDRDGALGQGLDVTGELTLPAGQESVTHVISVEVTDSVGATDEAVVSVIVVIASN